MSNQINLDLLADTSQAQKAINDLTRDVDKLQKKAANTQFKSGKVVERKEASTAKRPAQHIAHPSRQVTQVDKSAELLRGALGDIVSELGSFGQAINDANSKFIDLVAKISLISSASKTLFGDLRRTQSIRSARDIARSDSNYQLYQKRGKQYRNQIEGYSGVLRSMEDRDNLTGRDLRQASDARRRVSYYTQREIANRRDLITRRNYIHSESMYGPEKGRLTDSQRYHRGLIQWTRGGRVGTPGYANYRNFSTSFMGMNTTRASGLVNMARGGAGLATASMGLGSGLGSGLVGALTNPYVLGAAAVGATVGAPLLYANHQVDKGRQKAEDLTDLETQFKNLSKNIAGVEVDALSKDLQKLAIEGAVPVQELSKGASMLMLAFKGNQKETSKWTQILADMSAGTGQSVDYFAELITKANQFGTVEFEVFNQLNEKGIPIIDQLKGKFGDTREEIMKAAQEGKITAAEFMKAFEAAHKVSMEGANARKAAASRMDIQKQTQEYEELEAANVTRGYDAAQMEYDKARRDRAKRRSEDEHVIATSEALGDALGDLVEVCRSVGDGISDAFGWAMHGIADMMGWDDDHANAAMDKIVQSTNNLWYDALDEKATSQGVESSLLQIQRDKERLSKIASNDEFDDDVRKRAKDYEEYLAGIIETLEKKAAELAKKEARAQEIARQKAERQARDESRQRASESYKQYKLDNAKTEEELLKLNGESSLSKVENKIKWIENRLESGYADESEFAELERLVALRDEIMKLREAIQKDAEEKKKLAEEERKAAERKAAEEKKLAAQREDYLLAAKVNRNENDYASKYELQYNRTADRMKSLGFSEAEIRKELALDKKSDLSDARKRLKENNEKIKQEEDNIKRAKMVGKEGIQNAWGSVERMVTSFSSPYEQNSLKELKDINKNLKNEINAIKGINTKSKAE